MRQGYDVAGRIPAGAGEPAPRPAWLRCAHSSRIPNRIYQPSGPHRPGWGPSGRPSCQLGHATQRKAELSLMLLNFATTNMRVLTTTISKPCPRDRGRVPVKATRATTRSTLAGAAGLVTAFALTGLAMAASGPQASQTPASGPQASQTPGSGPQASQTPGSGPQASQTPGSGPQAGRTPGSGHRRAHASDAPHAGLVRRHECRPRTVERALTLALSRGRQWSRVRRHGSPARRSCGQALGR